MTRTGGAAAERSQAVADVKAATHARYLIVAAVFISLFLVWIGKFYHPGTGYTSLIAFPEQNDREAPALRDIPHHVYPPHESYDGQFYAQRALDPLLKDPRTDAAMDSAPFRARRILFSWTAYLLGCGRSDWIIQAYALQNVLCWLILAVLLGCWIPPTSLRGLALWTACLFSHGLIWSVRFALLDGPSLLLIACAVLAAERRHFMASAAIVGLSALGRETNLLAFLAQPGPRDRGRAIRFAAALALALLPLMVWYDYLRSIYRSTLLTGADSFVMPGTGLASIWRAAFSGVVQAGPMSEAGFAACLLVALALQALFLICNRASSWPWWRVAIGYAVMMLFLHPSLVDPRTGAITRVLLPMTMGFNVLLARETRSLTFWLWFTGGNIHLVPALRLMSAFSL